MTKLSQAFARYLQRRFQISISRVGKECYALERSSLRKFLDEFAIDAVFDVGANSGQYADQLRSLGYSGPIISFEPIPRLADGLKERAASEKNWFVEQCALDEVERDVTFHLTSQIEFSSIMEPTESETSVHSLENKTIEEIFLRTSLLSHFYQKYEAMLGFKRPFIKMDTQGYDLNVARGGGDFFKSFLGLQSELAIKRLYLNQPDFIESIAFYRSMGFEISSIIPNHPHFPDMLEVDCLMYNASFSAS